MPFLRYFSDDHAVVIELPIFLLQVLKDATLHGAAVLGVPVKATIKEVISSPLCKSAFIIVYRYRF